ELGESVVVLLPDGAEEGQCPACHEQEDQAHHGRVQFEIRMTDQLPEVGGGLPTEDQQHENQHPGTAEGAAPVPSQCYGQEHEHVKNKEWTSPHFSHY